MPVARAPRGTRLKNAVRQWQWHQLGHMQVCTLLQTDNYASTLNYASTQFFTGWMPFLPRTNQQRQSTEGSSQ